jgi:hypothetical protein
LVLGHILAENCSLCLKVSEFEAAAASKHQQGDEGNNRLGEHQLWAHFFFVD